MQNILAKKDSAPQRLKVLLIEDIRTMREMLVRSLKRAGITDIVEMTSADQALGSLLLNGPSGINVILTDTTLPGMSCAAFLKRLRSVKGNWARTVPVVVLSSDTTTASYASLRPFNIASYLLKPASTDLIKTALERAVSDRSHAVESQAKDAAAGIINGVPTLLGTALAGIMSAFQGVASDALAPVAAPRPASRTLVA